MSNEGSSLSALRENIATKGANSYYYAHATNTAGAASIKTTLGDSPRLLSKEVVSSPLASTSGGGVIQPIETYSWSDADGVIKLYATVPPTTTASGEDSFHSLIDDNIFISSDSRSFELRVVVTTAAGGSTGAGGGSGSGSSSSTTFVLKMKGLRADITGASAKKGKTKIVVTLTKSDPLPWYELVTGSGFGGEDV